MDSDTTPFAGVGAGDVGMAHENLHHDIQTHKLKNTRTMWQ